MKAATFKIYLCWALEILHEFEGNADAERVPNQHGMHVCREHLAEVNRCRRDKGLEELVEFADSYPRKEVYADALPSLSD